MVVANERILNRQPGGPAPRRRRSLCRSVADRPVDCVTSLCHDDRQSRFPLRSPPLPRGSNNVVSSRFCGERSVSDTQPLVNNLYQGMALDSVSGLYYERFRNYSPSLGIRNSQYPLSHVNGANTYQFVMSNPVGKVDPSGMSTCDEPQEEVLKAITKALSDDNKALSAANKLDTNPPPCPAEAAKLGAEYTKAMTEADIETAKATAAENQMAAQGCFNERPPTDVVVPPEPEDNTVPWWEKLWDDIPPDTVPEFGRG